MNNLSLEELDKLAYNFKNTDKMKMLSLHFEERAYLATIANLYMMYDLIGSHIKDKVIKVKQSALTDFRQIHNELYFYRLGYEQWCNSIKISERSIRELRKELSEGNVHKSLELALKVISTLLKENTLVSLYQAVMQSKVTDDEIDTAVSNYAQQYNLDITSKDCEKIVYRFLSSLGTSQDLLCFQSMSDDELNEVAKKLPGRQFDGIKTEISEEYINALLNN